MKRTKLILATVILIVVALNIAFFTLNYTKEGNALLATNFVKNEATYKFDGMPQTFKLTGTAQLQCAYCWGFTFEYQSRNSGYGDRKDAAVNTVITNHTAAISMEKGDITSAVLDGVWDMNTQKLYAPSGRATRGTGR